MVSGFDFGFGFAARWTRKVLAESCYVVLVGARFAFAVGPPVLS